MANSQPEGGVEWVRGGGFLFLFRLYRGLCVCRLGSTGYWVRVSSSFFFSSDSRAELD